MKWDGTRFGSVLFFELAGKLGKNAVIFQFANKISLSPKNHKFSPKKMKNRQKSG